MHPEDILLTVAATAATESTSTVVRWGKVGASLEGCFEAKAEWKKSFMEEIL